MIQPNSKTELCYAGTPNGKIHYATAGKGEPLLLLHQTPRSWDEYRDVLPLLGLDYYVIAMDMVDFGNSYRLMQAPTIEDYAQGVIDLLDALGIERTNLVGHHTGGVVALEVAAGCPERVSALILSSTPYVDSTDREQRKTRPPIDEVDERADGRHLTELWQKRMPYYPVDRPDLLTRFVMDALKVWGRMEAGHRAVGSYPMEMRAPLIKNPTLLVGASEDPFALPHLKPLSQAISGSRSVVIQGGMVPLPDQMPEKFAAAVSGFLNDLKLEGKKILVVDDDPDVLETVEELLECCRVEKAQDAESARSLIRSQTYDAAILDIMGVKGYELLDLTVKKGLPTLMLTAHALTAADFTASMKRGAQAYVPKDHLADLKTFLVSVLEESTKTPRTLGRWFKRLEPFFRAKFGENWQTTNEEFWKNWNV